MSRFSFKSYLNKIIEPSKKPIIIESFDPQISFLAKIGINSNGHKANFSGLNIINNGVYVQDEVTLGFATTIGHESWLRGPIKIGNYCQLGPRVCIHATDHATGLLTTFNGATLLNGLTKKFIKFDRVELGHGVWCGYGSIILKGVRIGNGAIIGAGAVVTKDVPAYHIAVGNPARVMKARFDEEVCELIDKSRWWEAKMEKLEKFSEIFTIDFNIEKKRGLNLVHQFINDQD